MSIRVIETPAELKNLYLQTNIADIAEVQSTIKALRESPRVEGKEKYIEALNTVTTANIKKAQIYQRIPSFLRHLGWGLMALFFVLAMIYDDSGLFEESTVTWPYAGFWIGIGTQIGIAVLKSAWNKLTLAGAVIHPVISATQAPLTPNPNTQNTSGITTQTAVSSSTSGVFCSQCGRKNQEGTLFCENCGTKL